MSYSSVFLNLFSFNVMRITTAVSPDKPHLPEAI